LVAGIPDPVSDPAFRVVTMAREMESVLQTIDHAASLRLRIGISKGPAAAGVVGSRKLFYDVWGHTVNLASRLEGLCTPGRILVSAAVRSALEGRVDFEPNDPVEVRGIGAIDTYYLS
ncbi:MAG: adenylate/guanylate cyclase domain-containing protein, partial [Hyphomicrobiales bacterium]